MSEVARVKTWLFNAFKVAVPDEWLSACWDWITEEQRERNSRDSFETKCNHVFNQWLLSDLANINTSSFPVELSSQMKFLLCGLFPVQVNCIVDISMPLFKQVQKLTGAENENVLVTTLTQQTQQQEDFKEKTTRTLMMKLTDGTQEVKAIEVNHIPSLNANMPLGSKLLIHGNILCRFGVLLLKAENVILLGGDVDDLVQELNPLRMLENALQSNNQPDLGPQNGGNQTNQGGNPTNQRQRRELPKKEFAGHALLPSGGNRPPKGGRSQARSTRSSEGNDEGFPRNLNSLSSGRTNNERIGSSGRNHELGNSGSTNFFNSGSDSGRSHAEDDNNGGSARSYRGNSASNPPKNRNYPTTNNDGMGTVRNASGGSSGSGRTKPGSREISGGSHGNPGRSGEALPRVHVTKEHNIVFSDDDDLEFEMSATTTADFLAAGATSSAANPATSPGKRNFSPNLFDEEEEEAMMMMMMDNNDHEIGVSSTGNANHPSSSSMQNQGSFKRQMNEEVTSPPPDYDNSNGSKRMKLSASSSLKEAKKIESQSHPRPFTYLKNVFNENQCGIYFIKAYISTIISKLEHNGGTSWSLRAKINDGTGTLDVELQDKLMTKLIGYSASEMEELKRKAKTDLSLRETIKRSMSQCQEQLVRLSAIFELHVVPSNLTPSVSSAPSQSSSSSFLNSDFSYVVVDYRKVTRRDVEMMRMACRN